METLSNRRGWGRTILIKYPGSANVRECAGHVINFFPVIPLYTKVVPDRLAKLVNPIYLTSRRPKTIPMAPVTSIISELRQKTASEQVTLFIVAIFFALIVRILTILAFGNLRRLPGPFSSRLTGLPLSIAAFKGRRAQWLYELHKKYGPVVRVAPGEVSVADSAHYRTIYANPKASHKDPSFYGAASFTGLDNIFQMVNREQHAAHRKLVAAPYSLQAMHKLEHIIRNKSRLLADRFVSDAATSRHGTVDAYELCALFSFELVCAAGFAKDISSRSSALSVLRAMETSGPRFIFNSIFPPLKDGSCNTKMPGRVGATYMAHNYWHECSRQMVRESGPQRL